MCIICYKPAGVQLPEKSVLKNCWSGNPDGAGIMYRTNKGVVGQKGFMKQKNLLSALLDNDFTGTDLVIHFRWATHGLRDKTATHPFPLSCDTRDLTSVSWKAEAGLAHNGIISGYGTDDLSDTQEFIKLDLGHFSGLADRPEVEKYIKSKGGRYVLMTAKRTIIIGDFISDHGCYWSNSDYKHEKINWRHWKPTKYHNGVFSDYDDFGPINTDICPYSGRIANIQICESCSDYDHYDMICKSAWGRK
jgi:hypothetical protein